MEPRFTALVIEGSQVYAQQLRGQLGDGSDFEWDDLAPARIGVSSAAGDGLARNRGGRSVQAIVIVNVTGSMSRNPEYVTPVEQHRLGQMITTEGLRDEGGSRLP